jgi:hypothetical protein
MWQFGHILDYAQQRGVYRDGNVWRQIVTFSNREMLSKLVEDTKSVIKELPDFNRMVATERETLEERVRVAVAYESMLDELIELSEQLYAISFPQGSSPLDPKIPEELAKPIENLVSDAVFEPEVEMGEHWESNNKIIYQQTQQWKGVLMRLEGRLANEENSIKSVLFKALSRSANLVADLASQREEMRPIGQKIKAAKLGFEGKLNDITRLKNELEKVMGSLNDFRTLIKKLCLYDLFLEDNPDYVEEEREMHRSLGWEEPPVMVTEQRKSIERLAKIFAALDDAHPEIEETSGTFDFFYSPDIGSLRESDEDAEGEEEWDEGARIVEGSVQSSDMDLDPSRDSGETDGAPVEASNHCHSLDNGDDQSSPPASSPGDSDYNPEAIVTRKKKKMSTVSSYLLAGLFSETTTLMF